LGGLAVQLNRQIVGSPNQAKGPSVSELLESQAEANPYRQFARWYADAVAASAAHPEAMTAATATPDGVPSARMVLLKEADERGFVFFTNYESAKGHELAANPRVALVFYWPELHRQVRVTGLASPLRPEESDLYFDTRPRGSQIGAQASPQSQVLADRAELDERVAEVTAHHAGRPVPRPAHWGGYRVAPTSFEFWQGRPDRLHDRLRYRPAAHGGWEIERLAP
jgi:pyridoxamine 5'-phosphate oxidase